MTLSESISSKELRELFLNFFKERGHREVSCSSLSPEGDASVLFTTAGMQQFKACYLKPKTAPAPRVVTIQPCFRTTDIEEVGDKTHLTLFEMMGNFSFGYRKDSNQNDAYYRKDAITWAWEFLTNGKYLGFDVARLYATYFSGDKEIAADKESLEILRSLPGLKKIVPSRREDNFWGPTGLEGPCGPTVEFYVDGIEVWNLVFNEYYFKDNRFEPARFCGVDTGAGLERLLVALNGFSDVYETDLFQPLIEIAKDKGVASARDQRIVADHIKASVFALSDGILPANKEAGYVVRRLLRRAMVSAKGASQDVFMALAKAVASQYGAAYPGLREAELGIIETELNKWRPIEVTGEKFLNKLAAQHIKKIDGETSFRLYQSHGFPIELTKDLAEARDIKVDEKGFWREFEKHQTLSKSGAAKKFKGGLAGHSDMEIRYHTATHLLHSALREVLGEHVFQRGSNINPERLRFDFSHPQAMTATEIAHVEALVNEKIKEDLPVTKHEMAQAEARGAGAIGLFGAKYGNDVSVFRIGGEKNHYSLEFCGGPHVSRTGELGEFKILKEESVGAGLRRIKAQLSSNS